MTEKTDQNHHHNDKVYKEILGNKKAFLELINTYVEEEWVQNISEDDLVLVNKSFVLQDFKGKEADIVYLLRAKKVIFYILLELQSTVDFLMPFRILMYMVEIWRYVFQNTKEKERTRKGFLLPAIIPVVLYNGEYNWTAKRDFAQMIAGYKQFRSYLPGFEYILFDVNRYTEAELLQNANLISSVFFLDQKMSFEEIVVRLSKIADIIRNFSPEDFHLLKIFLKHQVISRLPADKRNQLDNLIDDMRPWGVDGMILNLQVALDEAIEKAQKKGEKTGEKNSKTIIALKALQEGVDIDIVVKITGLSKKEVQKLAAGMQLSVE